MSKFPKFPRYVTEPKVFVVGRQVMDESAVGEFLESEETEWHDDSGNPGSPPEQLAEMAGRLCYDSYANPRPGGNAAYIKHILDVGHSSVLEHAVWNLVITGVSRTLTHELVRHRVGVSPSQRSQRYCDESDAAFVVPPAMLPDEADWQTIRNARADGVENLDDLPGWEGSERFIAWLVRRHDDMEGYAEVYQDELIRQYNAAYPQDGHKTFAAVYDALKRNTSSASTSIRKAAREVARNELPGCTETKIFITINARAAHHLLTLRGSEHADAEFRRLAVAILRKLAPEAPSVFARFKEMYGRVERR